MNTDWIAFVTTSSDFTLIAVIYVRHEEFYSHDLADNSCKAFQMDTVH